MHLYIRNFSCQERGSRSCQLLNSFNGTSLAVSHWKLGMYTYGRVSIQPSQPEQAIFRTGFDFNVFLNGVLQFQLYQIKACWIFIVVKFFTLMGGLINGRWMGSVSQGECGETALKGGGGG